MSTETRKYTNPDCVKFVRDMKRNGIETVHYNGRFFWKGPAVRTNERDWPTQQDVIRATKVKVQWDNLGLDYIVYPHSSDEGTEVDD